MQRVESSEPTTLGEVAGAPGQRADHVEGEQARPVRLESALRATVIAERPEGASITQATRQRRTA